MHDLRIRRRRNYRHRTTRPSLLSRRVSHHQARRSPLPSRVVSFTPSSPASFFAVTSIHAASPTGRGPPPVIRSMLRPPCRFSRSSAKFSTGLSMSTRPGCRASCGRKCRVMDNHGVCRMKGIDLRAFPVFSTLHPWLHPWQFPLQCSRLSRDVPGLSSCRSRLVSPLRGRLLANSLGILRRSEL